MEQYIRHAVQRVLDDSFITEYDGMTILESPTTGIQILTRSDLERTEVFSINPNETPVLGLCDSLDEAYLNVPDANGDQVLHCLLGYPDLIEEIIYTINDLIAEAA